MKRIFLCVFILLPILTSAQSFSGGISGGLSASQIDGDNQGGYHKPGVVAGVFVNTEFWKNSFIQFEIKYTGKGSMLNDEKNSSNNFKRILHYAELPVTFNYIFKDKFIAVGGLVPAYLIASKLEDNDATTDELNYKNTDLGWLLGAKYIVNDKLKLDVRLTYSLLTISKSKIAGFQYSALANTLGYNVGDYNNSVSLTLEYTLGR